MFEEVMEHLSMHSMDRAIADDIFCLGFLAYAPIVEDSNVIGFIGFEWKSKLRNFSEVTLFAT